MEAATRNPEMIALSVLSCLLVFLPIYVPLIGLFLAILIPFPLVLLGLKYPWRIALSVLTLEMGLLLFLSGSAALFLLSHCGVLPLVMAVGLRLSYPLTRTIVLSVALPLVVSVLLLLLYCVIVQQTPGTLLRQNFEQAVHMMQMQIPETGQKSGTSNEMNASLVAVILSIVPGFVTIQYLFTTVLNYVVVRRYCQLSQATIQIDPPDLTLWRTPDHLVWVFVGSGIGLILPLGLLSQFCLNIFIVTLALYFLQGVAITVFWGRRVPLPIGFRLFLILFLILFMSLLCVGLCTLAGLFDLWVDFRRLRRQPLVS